METKHRLIGSDVVKNGVFQSIEHYILAVQMDRKCSRSDALLDAVKLLEDIKDILSLEYKKTGGLNGKKS